MTHTPNVVTNDRPMPYVRRLYYKGYCIVIRPTELGPLVGTAARRFRANFAFYVVGTEESKVRNLIPLLFDNARNAAVYALEIAKLAIDAPLAVPER